jgi:hypothetical protein
MLGGLSFEGLLLQTQRVLRHRWQGLLAAVLFLGLTNWGLDRWMTAFVYPSPNAEGLVRVAYGLTGALAVIGWAVMIWVVARTGRPSRPLSHAAVHVAVASVTVLAALAVASVSFAVLTLLPQSPTGEAPSLLTYATAFAPLLFQLVLFTFLGMTVPAAMERPVGPWAAIKVALKLGQGRHIWVFLLALGWTVGISLMGYAIRRYLTGLSPFHMGMSVLTNLATAFATGVLYLELRRLHAPLEPASAAETFA